MMDLLRALRPPADHAPTSELPPDSRPIRATAVRTLTLLALAALGVAVTACGDDGIGPTPEPEPERTEVGVVLNSVDRSLNIFPVDRPDEGSVVGLGSDGSPVGFSHRGNVAAVPMGIVPSVAVVDLRARRVVRTVGLPENSGATGSAFVNDSVVLVANPNLDSATPVNVLRGTTGSSVDVGTFPQAVASTGERVLVANAELGPDFSPSGPGTVTVLDASTLTVEGTVTLSGLNPSAVSVGPEGRVWVLNSGRFGGSDGSVSVVDPEGLREAAHHTGFGEFPGGMAFGPDGLLHVASLSYGIAVWDPSTGEFRRPPAEAVAPNGIASVSELAFDVAGRLHALVTILPDQDQACFGPGAVYRLGPDFQLDREIRVGTCPFDLAFLRTEG